MGSSMVMMWSVRVELMRSTMAASVVDLPLPVVPVTSTMPRRFLANLVDHLGQVEFFQGADLGGNDAEHHAHVAALLENVHAEAAQARHAVSHVEFGVFLELLLLPVGHHAERHVQHVFAGDARVLRERRGVRHPREGKDSCPPSSASRKPCSRRPPARARQCS